MTAGDVRVSVLLQIGINEIILARSFFRLEEVPWDLKLPLFALATAPLLLLELRKGLRR